MNAKTEAIASADAHTTDAGLPSYTDLLRFAQQRMAYPQAGEALMLEDYRNIARNVAEPDGQRIHV